MASSWTMNMPRFLRAVRTIFAVSLLTLACSNAADVRPSEERKGIVLASGQNHPSSIALDATSLYWTNWGSGARDGAIVKLPFEGGSPMVLSSGLCYPTHVFVDDSSVYWTAIDCVTKSNVVMKTSSDGGGTTTT